MKIETHPPVPQETHSLRLAYIDEYDVHQAFIFMNAVAGRNNVNFADQLKNVKRKASATEQKALFEQTTAQLKEHNMFKTVTQLRKDVQAATKDNKLIEEVTVPRLSKEQVTFIGSCLQTYAADVFSLVPPLMKDASANGSSFVRTVETIVAYEMIAALDHIVDLPVVVEPPVPFGLR